MADSFVQVAPDSTGKKIQTLQNTVGGNTVEAQAVVLVDSSGVPYSPLTSISARNTARVDASGDDPTGVVGDLSKPFLTGQAAVTAAEGLGLTDFVLYLNNNSVGAITTSLPTIDFVGENPQITSAIGTLTLTYLGQPEVFFRNVAANDVVRPSGGSLVIHSFNTRINSIDATGAGGNVYVFGFQSSLIQGNVTSDNQVLLSNIQSLGTLKSNTGDQINLDFVSESAGNNNGFGIFGPTIDSPGSDITAIQSVIKQVTNGSTLTLTDSRVTGTINISSPPVVYSDILLSNATTSKPGTIPPLSGNASDVFKGDGSFAPGGSQNLIGPITSIGANTAINSQTGTGNTFVMSAGSPNISTPNFANGFTINGVAPSGKIPIGNATNYVESLVSYPNASVGAGKVIISDGTNYIASTPTFPNASAVSGKFIRSDGTNWIASTPTLPTSTIVANKILASDGANYIESTPTFPANASAAIRKVIKSDGTNWVASTEAYAAPGTTNNVLTSDGTNWISSPPSAGWTTLYVTGSNFSTNSGSPINVTGLVATGLVAASAYTFESVLYCTSDVNGCNFLYSGGGTPAGTAMYVSTLTNSTAAIGVRQPGSASANVVAVGSAIGGVLTWQGMFYAGSAGTLFIQTAKNTSGTINVNLGSYLRYRPAGT